MRIFRVLWLLAVLVALPSGGTYPAAAVPPPEPHSRPQTGPPAPPSPAAVDAATDAGAVAEPSPQLRPLEVHFFDVGQGDAALIISPTGRTVLIDGGPPEAGAELAARVDALVEGPLDLMMMSHPHLDHLGGLTAVLQRVGTKRFLEPDFDHPTVALAQLRERVNAKGISKQLARFPTLEEERRSQPEGAEGRFRESRKRVLEIGLGGGAVMELLWPRLHAERFLTGTRSDANANSIVARLRYGTTAFLFTGDSEEDTERRLIRSGRALRADVLKVAHHGSRHSSSVSFLEAVRPQAAVISSARVNDYGHPHRETVRRLKQVGAELYWTAELGEIVARSDGARVWMGKAALEEKTPDAAFLPAAPYVGSRRSDVFHRADCENARTIKPENLISFPDRESALRGRRPAKDCNP